MLNVHKLGEKWLLDSAKHLHPFVDEHLTHEIVNHHKHSATGEQNEDKKPIEHDKMVGEMWHRYQK